MNRLSVSVQDRTYKIEINPLNKPDGFLTVKVDDEVVSVNQLEIATPLDDVLWMVIDNHSYELIIDHDLRWIRSYNGVFPIEIRDEQMVLHRPRSGDTRVKAPIPGLITRIFVENDQSVDAGEPIVILEAMKMENEIRAPHSGKVKDLNVTQGQSVSLGDVIVEII